MSRPNWTSRRKRDPRVKNDPDFGFSGFPCQFCPHPTTAVVDCRSNKDGSQFRRRRICKRCGNRFTTYEVADVYQPDYQI